jgi:hypothetical protein
MKFSIGKNQYEVDQFGVIKHLNPVPFVYDESYVSIYDTPAYQQHAEYLQALRLGFVLGSHGKEPQALTDCGYGTGAFMKEAKKIIPHVWGVDLTGVQVEGCYIMPYITKTDILTLWDCLEHFHDLSFLLDVPAETICISLPYCHFHTEGLAWMETKYCHLKPSEHIRHFNEFSLSAMMASYGWTTIAVSAHEDIVRKSTHGLQNILSMAFKRK